MNEKKYYIYIYLDPRKPGKYKYCEYEFDHEPFYVGFGYGNRYKQHTYPSLLNKDGNKLKVNKILKILSLNLFPIIIKLSENLLLQEAQLIEMNLIKNIGRINLQQGTLTNLTDGGESNNNRIISEKDRLNRSERIRGKKNPNYGGMSDEAKKKMSENHADFNGDKNPNYGNGDKIRGEKHPLFGKHHKQESIDKMKLSKSIYIYEIISPTGKIFERVLILSDFFKNNNIGYHRNFDFINNMGKYKGWIIKRNLKEK